MKAKIRGLGGYIGLIPDQVAEVLHIYPNDDRGRALIDVLYPNGTFHDTDTGRGLIFFGNQYEIVEDDTRSPVKKHPTKEYKPKLIQILIGPENAKWQGKLIGLADNGAVYVCVNGDWALYCESI